MKTKYYFLIGFLALSTFLIINIPAAPVYEAIKDKVPQLQIQNIEGTIWQGSAQQVMVKPGHVLKEVSWSVCVTHILMAEACVDFDANYNDSPLSGQIAVDMNKNVQGKNIRTSITAKALSQMITMQMGEIAGNIDVDLATISWQQGGIPAISGVIKWNDASVTIAETAKLGDIIITLKESVDNPISAEISNQDGHLEINGQATLNEKTDYTVNLKLIPRDKANQNLKNSLSLFAQPGPNGSFILKNNGNLKQLGLM
jgi:hypothetical protein